MKLKVTFTLNETLEIETDEDADLAAAIKEGVENGEEALDVAKEYIGDNIYGYIEPESTIEIEVKKG